MSWSVSAMGKGSAVAAKVKEELSRYKCAEPEETIKEKISEAIQAACNGAPNQGFNVSANGSQYSDGGVVKGMNFSAKVDLVQLAE